jgi:superfamily I DNA/RNA helicase
MTIIQSHPTSLSASELTILQQQIVFAPLEGEIVVGGVAGSGKTIAAIHRAAYLCANTPRHKNRASVLFLCYNRPLARAVQRIISTFPSSVWTRVEVRTLHQWCWPYVRRQLPGYTVINDGDRVELLRQAIQETKYAVGEHDVFSRSTQFFLDELRLIKGCRLIEVDEYLDQRVARSGSLSNEAYQIIFTVAERYSRLLRERQQIDYDDYAQIALSVVEQSRDSIRYDHVILDESQDLSSTQIELGRRLARQSLLLIADQEQTIYRIARLSESLPPPQCYGVILPESLRTTAEIFDLARHLLPEHVVYVRPEKHGSLPTFRSFRWIEDEADFIADTIAELLAKGVAPADIAVLVRQRDVLAPIIDALEQHAIPICEDQSQECQSQDNGIVLTTIFLAKGREFRVVFVPGLVEGVLPRIMPEMDRAAVGQEIALARRQLYVAMTRAREWLYLTAGEGQPSRILAEMGFRQVQAEKDILS